ncbi:MAG TPA: hypothetical protein VFA94_13010 [Acidimicrobiales bacterium]|nr:hypothetical protein [Acidimicrobiales bacterium]
MDGLYRDYYGPGGYYDDGAYHTFDRVDKLELDIPPLTLYGLN